MKVLLSLSVCCRCCTVICIICIDRLGSGMINNQQLQSLRACARVCTCMCVSRMASVMVMCLFASFYFLQFTLSLSLKYEQNFVRKAKTKDE